MTTLSAARTRGYTNNQTNALPISTSTTIWGGAAVGIDPTTRLGDRMRPGYLFVGFAKSSVNHIPGQQRDNFVTVIDSGEVVLAVSGAVQADVGKDVYATDDDTFVLTSSGGSFVGVAKQLVASGKLLVEIAPVSMLNAVRLAPGGTALVSGDGEKISWIQGYWGPHKLRRSLAKIGQAYARQASIGVFGHSVVAGAYANDVVSTVSPADRTWNSVGWVGVLRRVVAARYGTASVGGLLHPAENFSTNFTVGGGGAQAGPNFSAGLAGYRINLAAAADTVSVTGTGRYLRVWGYALTAGLKARYTIDGGSLTTDPGSGSATATPSGSQYWYTFDIDCTTDAEHTVVLQGAASGSWYFWGAAFLAQTTSGVLVHRLGRSSAVLPDIVAVSLDATDTAGPAWRTTLNDANKTQQLEAVTARLGLDLAICMVDANDVSGGWATYGYTLADIRRHAQNFADRVTALDIDVLFVTGPQRDPAAYASGVPFTQDEAIAQYAAVAAATDRVAHIDLSVTYPTFALADADDLLIDVVHPNSRGHGWIGSRIGQALLAAV